MFPTTIFLFSLGIIILGTLPIALAEPVLYDENLVLEKFASEFGWGYTAMTFVENDILVLEKDGFVSLIRDGKIQSNPVLELSVDSDQESGLLGITSVDSTVYLFFTESDKNGETLGNRIYKYTWNGADLVDPILLKELPSNSYHNSGAMVTGLDNQVYAVIGDTGKYGPLQNKLLENLYPPDTTDYMDTSAILRVDPEGPYYAIGIRNSFGLAIDPVTGKMWATENGDDDFDEINFVPEKFNSGWNKIMGPATNEEIASLPGFEDYEYSDPEFTWKEVVVPVGLAFGNFHQTDKYDNSLFVGDCSKGNLYRFELNQDRDGFEFLNSDLKDKLVNEDDSMEELVIGTGFRCLTDIESGPDGFLYLITHGERTIYRILPVEALPEKENLEPEPKPSNGGGCLIATATYGSELAPQVQQLRELRDNQLLKTESGKFFMINFNNLYYLISPQIADFERENPVFREFVKAAITPLISSLSILNYVDMNSEENVLSVGISLILLNIGMYFIAPAILVNHIRKHF